MHMRSFWMFLSLARGPFVRALHGFNVATLWSADLHDLCPSRAASAVTVSPTTLRPDRVAGWRHLPPRGNISTGPTNKTRLSHGRKHSRISADVRGSKQWKLQARGSVLVGLATSHRIRVQRNPVPGTVRRLLSTERRLLRPAGLRTAAVLPGRGSILSNWEYQELSNNGHTGPTVLSVRAGLCSDFGNASVELFGLRLLLQWRHGM